MRVPELTVARACAMAAFAFLFTIIVGPML